MERPLYRTRPARWNETDTVTVEDVCFNVEESENDHVSELMTLSREAMRDKCNAFLHRF